MAKAHLTPISRGALKTVPRIELNAAKVAVVLYQKIIKELCLNIEFSFFWTDSTTTLNYIRSETGRFHRFVANRVAFIREVTKPVQWSYVPGEINPADMLSRGIKVREFMENKTCKTEK